MIGIVSGALGLIAAVTITVLIRRDKLHIAHGLGWLITALMLTFLGFAPSIFDAVALKLGIAYPPSLAFALGLLLLVIKQLSNDIQHSKLRVRQQRIIQRLSILETEMRRKKKAEEERAD